MICRFCWRVLLIYLLTGYLSSCTSESIVFKPLFKCSTKLEAPYGLFSHINRKGERWEFDTRDQELSMIDSLNSSWIRTDFDWSSFRTHVKGELSYEHFDCMMASVKEHKKNVQPFFVYPQKRTDFKEWAVYVKNVVKRYHQDIKYWEIINEADLLNKKKLLSWFTPNDYVELLKIGYSAIKSRDKDAYVLLTGVANVYNHFMDSVLSQNISNLFDIMPVHWYIDKNSEPESFCKYYKDLKDLQEKYGVNKPVWLNETGCSTVYYGVDEQTQARWLPRIFLISFAHGVDKVFWFKSRSCELDFKDKEHYFGLWHKDYSPKPAFYTYRTLVDMCPTRSSRPKLFRSGNVFVSSWNRPDGQKVWALWTSKEEVQCRLEVKGEYTVFNESGSKIQYPINNSLLITPSIIYIVGAKSVKL